MIKELTTYERMCQLANLDELTTKQIAEVASVGMNRAIALKKEIIDWMIKSGDYRVYNTIRIPTYAVFHFLSKDLNQYKGGR